MNAEDVVREIRELDEVLRLARDAEELASKPRERHKLLAELASIEMRLGRMQCRLVEAVTVEMLWRYMDCRTNASVEMAARRLLAEVLAVDKE